MMSINDVESVQKWIKGINNDPLAKILLNNSQLTQIQLETLLIDILVGQVMEKKVGYETKSKMRLTNKKISRGAFDRTLRQARSNMTRSILTVLLLGYIGVLETPSLSPFLEASNKLESYIREYATIKNEQKNGLKDENTIKKSAILLESLKNTIYGLTLSKKVLLSP